MASSPLVAEYDNMLRCIRCAACLTSCPTYVVTHKEEEGPRGRIAIMRGIVEGHLEITPDALLHLDNCLLCEACTDVCPTGIEMESMGIAFRETVADRTRPGPIVRLVRAWAFGWLFGDLSHFRVLARALWLYQRSGLQWLARTSGILGVLGMRDMEAMLPRIADDFVVPRGQTVGRGEAVQVFAGCMMSTAFADTTEATTRLVAAFGGQAQLTDQQVCCGALQAHSGDAPRARELARHNLAAFGDGSAPIVVNAAGCGAMLKHYGELLEGDPVARRFAARVCDISEFLATRQPQHPPRPVNGRVAVQDACHLLHAQRISAAPRALLNAIPGLDVVEVPERDICCGSAGIYNITHPELSKDLQTRKCANILATGCETVVTGNPGCLVQIQSGLPENVQVRHIVDVLAEAYAPAGGRGA
ncbi:MAG: heterodisulfide reductase-related iron-sulfur binding cluster [Chloroflexota bacterium]